MKKRLWQSGRSMVEMMGYMAVVVSVTAGIGTLISRTYDEYKYSRASLQIADLAAAIVRSSAVDPDYGEIVSRVNNLSGANSSGRKIIPKSFRIVGNKIYHAFGGTVTVATLPGDATKFAITFQNLSRRQCIELAMKEWQNNKTVDLFQIHINNNAPWYWSSYQNTSGVGNALPVKRSIITGTNANNGQCAASNNSIMWVFN